MRLIWDLRKRETPRPAIHLPRSRTLGFEPLEPRHLLTTPIPLDGWRSAIFDDGVHGTLDFEFSRDVPSVSPSAEPVGVDEPRFGQERLVTETSAWSLVWDADLRDADFFGSGWDHDGATPLAVVIDKAPGRMYFLRGADPAVHATVEIRVDGQIDVMQGSIPGFSYRPIHGIVHEGLVVFQTERSRLDAGRWVSEGVTFVYTQDYGATMHRVAQVGGGFDVPAIDGGVSDNIRRGNRWSFSNAFPERSADDLLGAWFPWTDYLQKSGSPKGGQAGLFRARRPDVGEPWVVEPNVLVYERWEPSDGGGLHAHAAGMFADGMASFWGDVDYRNHMVRHVASDLEHYTIATWTHNSEFQGAWSPPEELQYRIGNQGASTAPSAVHGEFLITGDEQPELVMKVQAPTLRADFDGDGDVDGNDLMDHLMGFGATTGATRADGDADGDGDVDREDRRIWRVELGKTAVELPPVIKNLKGSFPGPQTGARYAPRVSLWIHHLRGRGYVVLDGNSRLSHAGTIQFSVDGQTWTSLRSFAGLPYLYGDFVLTRHQGDIYAARIPQRHAVAAPLVLRPGGTNLSATDWQVLQFPGEGNGLRRVRFDGSQYVYADTGMPVSPQPLERPPVAPGVPIWEVTSTATQLDVGTYQVAQLPSNGDALHWFTAWHYSLNGDGIEPRIQLGSNVSRALGSAWVTNHQWVPGNAAEVPSPTAGVSGQSVRLFSGTWPAPRRWLMAVESLTEGAAPIYPMGPGASGSHELASLDGFSAGDEWTVGLSFGLPQVTAFTSWWDPAGMETYRPIATVLEDAENYLEIGIARTRNSSATLMIDVYVDGVWSGLLRFESVYLDAEDRAHLAISLTPTSIGATLLLPRGGYGVQSRTGIGRVGIQPRKVHLSNTTQTMVTPLEWFAVQVHPEIALSESEREAFVASGDFFSLLDAKIVEAVSLPSSSTLEGTEVGLPMFQDLRHSARSRLLLNLSNTAGEGNAAPGERTALSTVQPPQRPRETTASPSRRSMDASSEPLERMHQLEHRDRAEIIDRALKDLFPPRLGGALEM